MAAELFSLAGKTAMVTGGSRGIGQGMAIGLAEAGADVILIQVPFFFPPFAPSYSHDHALTSAKRSESSSTATKDAIEALGRKCHIYLCDMTDREALAALVPTITATHRVDLLLNVAGILKRIPAVDYPIEVYDEIMQTNLTATFQLCQGVGRYWIENNMKGKIINTASLTTFFGSVNLAAYSMSKGAVGQLTKALSNEWAAKGINVNAIAPG